MGMVRAMNWVTTGEPTIQRQRDLWVVRVAGYDAATGRRRVRQLGTYPTKKAAVAHLAAGLGELDNLKESSEARQNATAILAKLLQQPSRRARMAKAGRDLVDGRGRQRVADALQRLARR